MTTGGVAHGVAAAAAALFFQSTHLAAAARRNRFARRRVVTPGARVLARRRHARVRQAARARVDPALRLFVPRRGLGVARGRGRRVGRGASDQGGGEEEGEDAHRVCVCVFGGGGGEEERVGFLKRRRECEKEKKSKPTLSFFTDPPLSPPCSPTRPQPTCHFFPPFLFGHDAHDFKIKKKT